MSRTPIILAVAVCSFALVLAQGQANAQTVPFKITGGGTAPDGLPFPNQPSRPHWSVGVGTQLGQYHGIGNFQNDSLNPPDEHGVFTGTFESDGPYLFTAANGDVLACFYGSTDHGATKPGTYELIPVPELGPGYYVGLFVAQFVPDPTHCTGRFAGVNGGWTMYAMTAPFLITPEGANEPIDYVWYGEGTFTFAHGH
jgi:hypothetical protein